MTELMTRTDVETCLLAHVRRAFVAAGLEALYDTEARIDKNYGIKLGGAEHRARQIAKSGGISEVAEHWCVVACRAISSCSGWAPNAAMVRDPRPAYYIGWASWAADMAEKKAPINTPMPDQEVSEERMLADRIYNGMWWGCYGGFPAIPPQDLEVRIARAAQKAVERVAQVAERNKGVRDHIAERRQQMLDFWA